MKLVLLSVTLPGEMETPEAQLEAGEFITKRVIALTDLNEELKGALFLLTPYLSGH